MFDIWICVQQRDDEIEDTTYGLVTEAKRLITQLGEAGRITAVALKPASKVAGGRGVGKGENFDVIHALARAIGGSVGGTRPIIDWGDLPYERQIGQTGKYVSPRLIITCGISGANEYTAGMEKSQQVIAIDLNPRVRMFRFADLGVVGDVQEILPLLISRIEDQMWGYMHPKADAGEQPAVFAAASTYMVFIGFALIVLLGKLLDFVFDRFPGKSKR